MVFLLFNQDVTMEQWHVKDAKDFLKEAYGKTWCIHAEGQKIVWLINTIETDVSTVGCKDVLHLEWNKIVSMSTN